MRKLGLLTITSHPTIPDVSDPGPVDAQWSDLAANPSRRLRRVGLLAYASDQPYRVGYDVILARWGKTGLGRTGRVRPQKIGLLTLP